MDTAQWPQEIGLVKPIEERGPANTCPRSMTERRVRPQKEQALNCPRCNSTNTKFCYYNNYSLTQPRYFCKSCRRYWTEGGTLRNVPVGGGSRKNKRSTSSASSKLSDLNPPTSLSQFSSQNPKTHEGQDLNLAFQPPQDYNQGISQFVEVPKIENNNSNNNSSSPMSTCPVSALELLRTGIASRGLNSYIPTLMPDSNTLYSSPGFAFQELKPSLNFSVDGIGISRYGSVHGVQENGTAGRLLFPFAGMKQLSTSTNNAEVDHNKGPGDSSGYWNGMFGGGSW
ncbi:hypothetical protein L1049_012957 [Liquidambar formosana]|uniref:Dof zinc finger protein n=1 Tax=Liquidambar formosana TaxID=63359 RepID=A0AAP0WX73_LIQFO